MVENVNLPDDERNIILLIPTDATFPPTFNIPLLNAENDIFSKIVEAQNAQEPACLALDEQELDFLMRNLDWITFRPFVLNNIPDYDLPIAWHQVQSLLDAIDFDQVSDMLQIELGAKRAKEEHGNRERGSKPEFDEQAGDETPAFEPLM
jgi:hypothetical protein